MSKAIHPPPEAPKPVYGSEDWERWCLENSTRTRKECYHQIWLHGAMLAYYARKENHKKAESVLEDIEYIIERYKGLVNQDG